MRIATIVTTIHNINNLIIRDVSVTSTIIELNDRSLAIIDTGMADNTALLEQLDDMGYEPSDFRLVINTHLHPDHIGGNIHFTNARIIISRRELEYNKSLVRLCQHHDKKKNNTHDSADPMSQNRIAVLTRNLKELVMEYQAEDLVGPPEQIEFMEDNPLLPQDIALIAVPGHSIDDRAVLLQGYGKKALMAGDALFHRDLWQQATIPYINFNDDMFRRSAEYIIRFQDIIIPGHDCAFNNATGKYLETNKMISL